MSSRHLFLAIALLGATLLGCVAGIVALALASVPVPDVLQNIAVGAMTGLVGLLVQSPRQPDQPTDPTY